MPTSSRLGFRLFGRGDVGIAPYIYYVKIMDNFVKTIAKNKNILYNIYYQ